MGGHRRWARGRRVCDQAAVGTRVCLVFDGLSGVCAWGCVVAARKKKRPRLLLWILPASVPSAVLLFWLVSATFHGSSDDPRWSMGYLEEWREGGRQATHGGGCYGFLVDQARLVGLVSEDTLARARSECGELCREQAARRSFNPGVLKDVCREAGLLP